MNLLPVVLTRAASRIRGARRSFAVLMLALAAVTVLSVPVVQAAAPAP